jgi:hypothetical protein
MAGARQFLAHEATDGAGATGDEHLRHRRTGLDAPSARA